MAKRQKKVEDKSIKKDVNVSDESNEMEKVIEGKVEEIPVVPTESEEEETPAESLESEEIVEKGPAVPIEDSEEDIPVVPTENEEEETPASPTEDEEKVEETPVAPTETEASVHRHRISWEWNGMIADF